MDINRSKNAKVYINEDKASYMEFLKEKEKRRRDETRLDRLERLIEELNGKLIALENSLNNTRETT